MESLSHMSNMEALSRQEWVMWVQFLASHQAERS